MQNHLPQIIGIAASVFTGISLLPQLIKIIREKRAESISMVMIGVLFTGLLLWTIYGAFKKDLIIIISNSFSMLINLLIVVFSFIYKQKKNGRNNKR